MTPVPALTFAEFYAQVERLLPRGSFCVEVSAWLHRHDNGIKETRTLEYKVYATEFGRSFLGPSPEATLDALRHALTPAHTPESVQLGDLESITNPGGCR